MEVGGTTLQNVFMQWVLKLIKLVLMLQLISRFIFDTNCEIVSAAAGHPLTGLTGLFLALSPFPSCYKTLPYHYYFHLRISIFIFITYYDNNSCFERCLYNLDLRDLLLDFAASSQELVRSTNICQFIEDP